MLPPWHLQFLSSLGSSTTTSLVNGVRLHYAEAGQPASDVLLLQHGWPQHWWMWRDLIGPLSDRYRVIAPDLRGHGWSEKPAGDYRKDALMRDIIGLLDSSGSSG